MMKNNLHYSATVELTPSFHDTDAMGVVWHGNYLKFFEKAREALFQKFHYGYQAMLESGYAWPIVDTRVKFIATTTAEQKLRVTAQLEEYEHRIKIKYLIKDALSGQKTTTGYTIQVAVSTDTKEMSFVTPNVLLTQFGLLK